MSQEIQQISQLQKKLSGISEPDFLRMIADQLVKDFSRSGIEAAHDVPSTFKNKFELFDFAHHIYQKALKEQNHRIDSLLYLIDIPEQHVNHNFHDPHQTEVSTEVILIREAQKVFLRLTYSA